MSHTLIVGKTESGKSTLGKILARQLRQNGSKVAVLDPFSDPEWPADFKTTDAAEFLRFSLDSRSHFLFVDEAASCIGRYDEQMVLLATGIRHCGHACTFITHRLAQLNKTLRSSCTHLYLFTCFRSDMKTAADEWDCPDLATMPRFPKGHFAKLSDYGDTPIRLGMVDFQSKHVRFFV